MSLHGNSISCRKRNGLLQCVRVLIAWAWMFSLPLSFHSFIYKDHIGCHDKRFHHVGGVEGLSVNFRVAKLHGSRLAGRHFLSWGRIWYQRSVITIQSSSSHKKSSNPINCIVSYDLNVMEYEVWASRLRTIGSWEDTSKSVADNGCSSTPPLAALPSWSDHISRARVCISIYNSRVNK